MRVLLAFDKFKDALSAPAAVAAAAAGVPGGAAWSIDRCPLTDGGEGFAEILTLAAGGEWHRAVVSGPRGARVEAGWGMVLVDRIPPAALELLRLPSLGAGARLAVVELAQASGLALLPAPERDPWCTSTRGTGELLRAAVETGVDAVLLGLGGSATHDLALGALAALGWTFVDQQGQPCPNPVPANWDEIMRIEPPRDGSRPLLRIACDVDNPLLGPRGAAAVYAPQKGLRAGDYADLERATARMAEMLAQAAGRPAELHEVPGAGAAGGTAFGLLCGLDAQLVAGFELVVAWFDLEQRIREADVILTGEGRFDESSLAGKGPGTVVRRALQLGRPVHVLAGQIALQSPPAGVQFHGITPAGLALPDALARTAGNLTAAVARVLEHPPRISPTIST